MPFIGNKPTAVPLSGADIQDGTITSADLQSGVIQNQSAFKNIIINGDMSIAQRGTSQASAGSSGGSYQTLDRWKFFNNNLGVFTWSQDTDVPTGQGFANSMKFDCTTADAAPAAADYLALFQNIEGQNLQYLKKGTANAESLTLSFWVKSNKTGTYIAELFDNDNTRSISKSYTIDSSSTWEKKTITFAGDTTGTLDNDNNRSLDLRFWLSVGSDRSSGTLNTSWNTEVNSDVAVGQVNLADNTANNFWITGIQLEAGTSASDFEFLPVDVNLQRCYRYCYRINGNSTDEQQAGFGGWSPGNNTINSVFSFSPPLRAVPTVTESALKDTATDAAVSLTGIFDDNQSGLCNTVGVSTQADSGTPFTTNYPAFIRVSADTSAFIQFDAEL